MVNISSPAAEISDQEMKAIQDAIFKRYGIDFYNYEKKSFKRRLLRIYRRFGFSSSFDLWTRALKDPDFIHDFINEVSVGLTAMFRDPRFWNIFQSIIKEYHGDSDSLKIWHAACSTGEEIYSAGIALSELGMLSKVEAVATDISSNAIKAAESGKISLVKLPEYERNYNEFNKRGNFERYFTRDDGSFLIKPAYYKHVKFTQANLLVDHMTNEYYDVIFCRNVLIYFDNMAKLRVIDSIYKALKPGGFFIVGFFDSILGQIDDEQFETFDLENRIFRKRE